MKLCKDAVKEEDNEGRPEKMYHWVQELADASNVEKYSVMHMEKGNRMLN